MKRARSAPSRPVRAQGRQNQPAAGAENADDLVQQRWQIGYVFDDQTRHDQRECPVRERQRGRKGVKHPLHGMALQLLATHSHHFRALVQRL